MTFKTLIALAALAAIASPAASTTIASSSFDTSSEGWGTGEFTALSGTAGVTYDANGTITTDDNFGSAAFVAPAAYLGDKSGAFGGTISFSLSDTFNDALTYSPLALISGATVLYANPAAPPSTSTNVLTGYSVTLVGASFFTGNAYSTTGGNPVTDAQLLAVLANLDRLAIQADWRTGADFTRLDNVVLADLTIGGGVPEPATWAMMIGGIGLVGGTLRRRQGRATPATA